MQSSTVSTRADPPTAALRAVSPALEHYALTTLDGDLWKRPDLSPRDRSLVTVSALITRHQAGTMPTELERALDNGVTPAELSEVVTHLAFYTGWGNAMSAVVEAHKVFARRAIGTDTLPSADGARLPLDPAAEARRAAAVEQSTGSVSPGLVHFTGQVLFHDLWLRPALAPRDRSLVTVGALITAGQVAQLPFHLGKAMDNGLTKPEVGEVLAQLAFYAGWPLVFTAVPVVRDVLEQRL
jgi:4-carboxymuconolactone decarboxylase